MNDIVRGISQIRNSILYSLVIYVVLLILQLTSMLLNNLVVLIFVLLIALGALVLAVNLIVKLIQGIRILRRTNLIPKLNQRLDETVQYFFGAIITGIIGIAVIIPGFVFFSVTIISVGTVIAFGATIFSWLVMLRLIQVNGILGVYAQDTALRDAALSVKSLFYFQVGNTILSYLIIIFKGYLGMWYLAILIPSWLFSLYFLFVFISLLNQTMKVFNRA